MGSLKINKEPDCIYDMLIVDADAVTYRAGFATKEGEPLSNAIHNVQLILNDARETCPAKSEVLYLTSNDKSNFRFARATIPRIINAGKPSEYILDGYKANRKEAKKPEHYDAIREYLVEQENAEVVSGIEADDAMSKKATHLLSIGLKGIISTHDKDLNMVPVDIHDMIKKEISVYVFDLNGSLGYTILTEKRKLYGRGRAFFFSQMLTGDNGDNIPGIPGHGPVNAYNTIKACMTEQEYFDAVWAEYLDYSSSSEDAKHRFMEVAALLWMQLDGLIDVETYLEKEYFRGL